MSDIKPRSLLGESERVYLYSFFDVQKMAEVTITNPVAVYIGRGHAFHRVWDGETVHLCHAPGPIRDIDGNIVGICKITWTPKDTENPCSF